MPSLEIKLGRNADEFLAEVAGQHYILAYGDVRELLLEFCGLTGIEYVE